MATQTPNMGLTKWDQLSDPFSHTQLSANFGAIDLHDHSSGKGVPVPAGGLASGSVGTTALQGAAVTTAKLADLGVTTAKLADLGVTTGKLAGSIPWSKMLGTNIQSQLGVNDGTTVSRGKSIIAGSDSRTNTVYGTMPAPDQVASVVLPTDGLIFVGYQARWQNSVASNAKAAIFIGANQLKRATAVGAPTVNEAGGPTTTGADTTLATFSQGLYSDTTSGSTADVTTGQALSSSSSGIGGPCVIFAAAGTYTVSVQFKSASGSVTVTDRRLWVWGQGF